MDTGAQMVSIVMLTTLLISWDIEHQLERQSRELLVMILQTFESLLFLPFLEDFLPHRVFLDEVNGADDFLQGGPGRSGILRRREGCFRG